MRSTRIRTRRQAKRKLREGLCFAVDTQADGQVVSLILFAGRRSLTRALRPAEVATLADLLRERWRARRALPGAGGAADLAPRSADREADLREISAGLAPLQRAVEAKSTESPRIVIALDTRAGGVYITAYAAGQVDAAYARMVDERVPGEIAKLIAELRRQPSSGS